MNKQVALRIPIELYNEIVKDIPRTVSVNNRIIELIQHGLTKESKMTEYSLRNILSTLKRKYELLGGTLDT